ncbi:hypothetical protein ACXO22_08855, partial [Lactobacillus delbrueckii subsp. bulgaricus]
GGKLPARIGSCRARQESDGSLALFVFLGFYIFFKHRHHRKQAATMGLLTLIIGLVMLVNPTLATETATSVE